MGVLHRLFVITPVIGIARRLLNTKSTDLTLDFFLDGLVEPTLILPWGFAALWLSALVATATSTTFSTSALCLAASLLGIPAGFDLVLFRRQQTVPLILGYIAELQPTLETNCTNLPFCI